VRAGQVQEQPQSGLADVYTQRETAPRQPGRPVKEGCSPFIKDRQHASIDSRR